MKRKLGTMVLALALIVSVCGSFGWTYAAESQDTVIESEIIAGYGDGFLILQNGNLFYGSLDQEMTNLIAQNVLDAKIGGHVGGHYIIILSADHTISQYNEETNEMRVNVLSDVKEFAIASGNLNLNIKETYYAIKNDATLWSWEGVEAAEKVYDNVKSLKFQRPEDALGYPSRFIITNSGEAVEIIKNNDSSPEFKKLAENVKDIARVFEHDSPGGEMTYYLKNNGELYGEGYDEKGQTSDPVRTEYPMTKFAENVIDMHGAYQGAYFIKQDRSLFKIMYDTVQDLNAQVDDLENIGSYFHPQSHKTEYIFLKKNGELSDGVFSKIDNVVKLNCGYYYLALTKDGNLYALAPCMRYDSETQMYHTTYDNWVIAGHVTDFTQTEYQGIIYETDDGSIYSIDSHEIVRKITFPKSIKQHITVSDITEKTYGDDSFKLIVTPDAEAALTDFTFESSNSDVAEIAADGTITIKAAGETDITVKQAGDDTYAPFIHTQTLVVNPKPLTLVSLDLDEKTAVLDGVLPNDTVTLDFNQVNLKDITATDETTSQVTAFHFVLTGSSASNYQIATESMAASIQTENIVTITTTANGGTATGAASYIKGAEVTVTATPNSGYTFTSWTVDGKTVSTSATYTFTPDADVLITANFTKTTTSSGGGGGGGGGSSTVSYTVTYETNGGSAVAASQAAKNATVTEPAAPTKEGYSFAGWHTDQACTTPYDFTSPVTKNITLYAKWVENTAGPTQTTDPSVSEDWNNPFADIHQSDWFYDNVCYAYENKLFTGISDSIFAPNAEMTRAMLVTVLYRIEGEPDTQQSLFDDVAPDAWYAKAVAWAEKHGIVNGYDETHFAPEDALTREQIAAIMQRYAEYKGIETVETDDLVQFTDDADISGWAREAIAWAAGYGLISGRENNRLAPLGNITRAETAAVLQRFLEK